jgi:uncharacterized repeat protein (TIGR01451 family)
MFRTKNILNRMMSAGSVASIGLAALLCGGSPALAATKPSLGAAESFSVLAYLSMSAANPTTVSGDLGLASGLIASRTGTWIVGGSQYFGPTSLAAIANLNALSAYNNLAGQSSNGAWGGAAWSPTPGVYTVASSVTYTGTITLNGTASDVWVFQVGTDMTFAGSSKVVLTGSAQACNVFWVIGRDATIASNAAFVGTLIAHRDITVVTGATANSKLISLDSSLTTDGQNISETCAGAPPQGGGSTLIASKAFSPATINAGGVSTLSFTLTNVAAAAATNVSFIDPFPANLFIATLPNVVNTCGGTLVGGLAGGNSIGLTGVTLPAFSMCTISVDVTFAPVDCFNNVSGSIFSDQSTGLSASATLCAIGAPGAPQLLRSGKIPTLSRWAMIMFAALLALAGFAAIRWLV